MQNNKVKEVSLISATNIVDNSTDEAREFDIKANVRSSVAEVRAFESGEVRELGTENVVASFSVWEGGSDSINPSVGDSRQKLAIISAIYDFIDNVRGLYANPNA